MALSKSTLLVSLLLLVGCAVKFDPVEHSRIVDVRHRVDMAIQDHHCRDAQQAKHTAQTLHSDAMWLLFYSQHIPKNDSLQKMSQELAKTTEELVTRYRTSSPSTIYCELKLKNILTQVEVIQKTNSRRPR